MKELSRELKSLIAFGMEDQENSFYLDLRSMTLIKNPEKILPENMEKIPEWKPADGFRLMEEFVSSLKSEEIKGELSSVLSEGKGVFKNFKLSMKKHPLIEKNWLRFKENKFDGLIENWFKLLSESRKLEILSREEDLDNETDNLINSDFEFIPVSPEELQDLRSEYRGKTNSFFPFLEISPGLEKVLTALEEKHCELYSREILALKAQSMAGNNAGFVTIHKTNVSPGIAVISELKVFPEYRGMGLGGILLNDAISRIRAMGISEAVIWDSAVPVFFEGILLKNGFEKVGAIFRRNMLV